MKKGLSVTDGPFLSLFYIFFEHPAGPKFTGAVLIVFNLDIFARTFYGFNDINKVTLIDSTDFLEDELGSALRLTPA